MLLADVKGRILAAQTRAVLAVNAELVRLYWDIGRIILDRQRREGWGAAVIPRLALKPKNELPDLEGFSERNIDRMIAFCRRHLIPANFSPPAVAKIAQASDSLLWSVLWAHHVVLNEKLKDRFGVAQRRMALAVAPIAHEARPGCRPNSTHPREVPS